MKHFSVIIDPCSNILYASYYIYGLLRYFGQSAIHFSSAPFVGLRHDKDTFCLPFVIRQNGGGKMRYCIDTSDSNKCVYTTFYDWCDVYGKVNYNTSLHSGLHKIWPIAPNFAVKLWDKPKCMLRATVNYAMSRHRTTFSFRDFWRVYAATLNRKRIHDELLQNERGEHVDKKYVYMVGRWWAGQDECNRWRSKFIDVCKSVDGTCFEGGLLPEIGCCDEIKYLSERKYSYDEYLNKTQESLIVFNTPAYYGCHGWKLPEFLWLGKAIISTPFVNDLPEPLTHGKNIWFAKDENEIRDAIVLLLNDSLIRSRLEQGAREYWNEYCSPEKAILQFVCNNKDDCLDLLDH